MARRKRARARPYGRRKKRKWLLIKRSRKPELSGVFGKFNSRRCRGNKSRECVAERRHTLVYLLSKEISCLLRSPVLWLKNSGMKLEEGVGNGGGWMEIIHLVPYAVCPRAITISESTKETSLSPLPFSISLSFSCFFISTLRGKFRGAEMKFRLRLGGIEKEGRGEYYLDDRCLL